MMPRRRNVPAYHIERSISSRLGLNEYPCGCSRCRGGRIRQKRTISKHHRQYGRDPYLPYPVLTVDGRNVRGPVQEPEVGEEFYGRDRQGDEDGDFVWPNMDGVEFQQMMYSAFGHADALHADAAADPRNFEQTEETEDDIVDDIDFENLMQETVDPVYPGCQENRLQSGIVLLSLASVYGVSDAYLSALLTYLAGCLLPKSNCLPRTAYELKTMIRKLGLHHQRIHSCPEGHVLFQGTENGDLDACPTCNRSRYISGSSTVPAAVTRFFPLVPKLIRIYKCPKLAKLLEHHATVPFDGKNMTSVAHSYQWQEITRMFPEFADFSSHLRLALVADGVCPHSHQNSNHSTWIVLVAVYNLPGWLATKKFFLNLSLLIPGPRAPTSETFDVYLKPLVIDLLKLWHGVPAINVSRPIGQRAFTLKAILMWTVSDFPALGLLSGHTVKGYLACPVCGVETCAEHSRYLCKMVYLGSRRFLPQNHRFRRCRTAFNGEAEHRPPPVRRCGAQILAEGRARSEFLRNGGMEDSAGDPVKEHGVKRASILFALPYWKDLPVRNTVDVMHTEKNIAENIIKTLFGEKDSVKVRLDLQSKNIRPHLWLRRMEEDATKAFMPAAKYVLSKPDREKFLKILKSLRMPRHYSSSLYSKISKGKLSGLKSHDYHVLLQDILPLCLRDIGDPATTAAIVRLSRIFRKICSKTVDVETRESLFLECAETLCMLEKEFPPAFFDIMVHLTIHLVEELFLCGPVHVRWMYPYERYFKTLKGFVRNLAKPEGCMAKGYEVEEACGFVGEFIPDDVGSFRRVWESEEDPIQNDVVLEGKPKRRVLDLLLHRHMHSFVIENADVIEPYRLRYAAVAAERTQARHQWRSRHTGRAGSRAPNFPPHLCEVPQFADWLRDTVRNEIDTGVYVDEMVEATSTFPSMVAQKYRSMYSHGYHLRVKSAETGLRTCDSGIAGTFMRDCRSGVGDRNIVTAPVEYVGNLDEIIELDYGIFTQVVLVASWVKANYKGHNATVKKDKWGFTLANFNRMIEFGPDSFALPSHVQQVFYSECTESPGWRVVLRTEPRGRRVTASVGDIEGGSLFEAGANEDFDGLRVPENISEDTIPPSDEGRVLRNDNLFDHIEAEIPEVFDRALGESSESD